jgi:tetratricopeptide (TPR) repeat protein
MVRSNPARPAWRAWMLTLLIETGRTEEAKAELDALAAHDFADFTVDGDWLVAITLLADCAAALGDTRRAELLYELLRPHERVNVVIGLAAVCQGSAAQYLGRLAAAIGRFEEAAGHFEHALLANARLRAPVRLAHTQLDYAELLGPGDRRASELIDSAARIADDLSLPLVYRRVTALRGQVS